MISTLRGQIIKKLPPLLIVEVNNIGYEIYAPMTTFYELPDLDQTVLLYTHMVIREDAQQLYGFFQEKDRDVFRLLIKANGVGPKLGLSILSGITIPALIQAIIDNDTSQLIKIPGVGQKTASRLAIECRDAMQKLEHAGEFLTTPLPISGETHPSTTQDALDALIALGYKPAQAKTALEKIECRTQTASTQEMIRQALQHMMTR